MKLCKKCKNEIMKELELHMRHYKESNQAIYNFINSFYHGLEIE